jgi:hypothetical protein
MTHTPPPPIAPLQALSQHPSVTLHLRIQIEPLLWAGFKLWWGHWAGVVSFDFSFGLVWFGLVCDGKLVGWAACTVAWWVGVSFGLVFKPLAG